MDSPFVFTREVVNDSFIGRRDELSWLSSNLSNKEHTVLIAPTGFGKRSLVLNAFIRAKKQTELKLCVCNLFNIRDEHAFYTLLVHALFSTACSTASEWIALAEQLLPLSQPQILVDEKRSNNLQIVFNEQRLRDNADEVLRLPERIAQLQNTPFIIWINEFQEIADFEHSLAFQKRLAVSWKQHHQVGYLLCGSKVNAMRNLFAEKQPLTKFAENIPLGPIDEKLLVDFIIKSFFKSGRVITKDLAEILCRKVNSYPSYVQQLAHLCWLNTKGYVVDNMVDSAVEDLLLCNERLFRLLADSLSTPQISYLRAILDGIDRFSSAEVIARYRLSSSANITRVRGALEKKEIIHFVRNKPLFIDPVFELWLRQKYFDK